MKCLRRISSAVDRGEYLSSRLSTSVLLICCNAAGWASELNKYYQAPMSPFLYGLCVFVRASERCSAAALYARVFNPCGTRLSLAVLICRIDKFLSIPGSFHRATTVARHIHLCGRNLGLLCGFSKVGKHGQAQFSSTTCLQCQRK